MAENLDEKELVSFKERSDSTMSKSAKSIWVIST